MTTYTYTAYCDKCKRITQHSIVTGECRECWERTQEEARRQ